ncbi:MAG: hypothetical protein ACHQ50_10615, partial [Fimbriimonadales bacterium]
MERLTVICASWFRVHNVFRRSVSRTLTVDALLVQNFCQGVCELGHRALEAAEALGNSILQGFDIFLADHFPGSVSHHDSQHPDNHTQKKRSACFHSDSVFTLTDEKGPLARSERANRQVALTEDRNNRGYLPAVVLSNNRHRERTVH